MILDFHTLKMKFRLDLRGKYNFIIGNSGTGKSYLSVLIEQINSSPDLLDEQPLPIYTGKYAERQLTISGVAGAIFVFDEGYDSITLESLLPYIKASHNYFIFAIDLV